MTTNVVRNDLDTASRTMPYHFESTRTLSAPAAVAFAYLDDHTRLAAHMSQSSWMMAGSRMSIETDDADGHATGSVIQIKGRILGLRLSVDEIVTEHSAPDRKVWQTIGTPRLLVVGDYRMGFAIAAQENVSSLRVFIDYALPKSWPARWLGRVLGAFYARWCTDSMANDAASHFQREVRS